MLSALQQRPEASDAKLAVLARTKEATVTRLFENWRRYGIGAVRQFGRTPELSQEILKELKAQVLAGDLADAAKVRDWVYKQIPGVKEAKSLQMARARALYRDALGTQPRRRVFVLPPNYLAELKARQPAMAKALGQIADKGSSVAAAARQCQVNESTLRYYLRRASDDRRGTHLPLALGQTLQQFLDRSRTNATLKNVRKFLVGKGVNKSDRSIHRYIQDWKDLRHLPRRRWSCGGSIHP